MADPLTPAVTQFYLDGDPHLTPERLVAHHCEARGIAPEQIAVKPVVVATFFPQLALFLAERNGARRSDFWTVSERGRELYLSDEHVCIATLPMGAPAATFVMEELIACGARRFLIVGAAGSLQPDLTIGSIVLPATAVREEGTSHHYLPPEVSARATSEMVESLRAGCRQAGIEPRVGLHWTTDALYREHKEKIAAYRGAGVLSVDMEVSALFALAQHRGVACAAILSISDELYEPWRIGFRTPEFESAVVRASLAALEAATGLAGRRAV